LKKKLLFFLLILCLIFPFLNVNSCKATSISYTEVFSSFTIGASGAWTDYDIYSSKGIPKDSVVEIICANGDVNNEQYLGVRHDGSGIDRRYLVHECETAGTGITTIRLLTPVDASTGLIECYVGSYTLCTFYIVGYWIGVSFTDVNQIVQNSLTGWRDMDWYTSYGCPKGRVYDVILANAAASADRAVGVRTDGSTLERRMDYHEAESGGESQWNVFVKTDASTGIVEFYAENTADCRGYITGWFGSDMDYQERWQQIATGTNAWEDKDLTAYLDQDNRVVDFALTHKDQGASCIMGARQDGSSLERKINEHEGEDAITSYYTGFGITTKTDPATGIVELFCETANDYFWLAGYFKFSAGAQAYVVNLTLSNTSIFTLIRLTSFKREFSLSNTNTFTKVSVANFIRDLATSNINTFSLLYITNFIKDLSASNLFSWLPDRLTSFIRELSTSNTFSWPLESILEKITTLIWSTPNLWNLNRIANFFLNLNYNSAATWLLDVYQHFPQALQLILGWPSKTFFGLLAYTLGEMIMIYAAIAMIIGLVIGLAAFWVLRD
jgi:hypothetical protein